MAQILDYSAGYPGGAAVQAAGFQGVIRYLKKEGNSSVKPLTAGEVNDMRAHGRTIALLYQHVQSNRPTQGRAAGQHDAHWALDQANAVGITDSRAIYFAVDFDAVPETVAEYFRGAADVMGLGRTGAYGGYKVIKYLFDHGLIHWGHQTVAWSSGNRDNRAHLFQRSGYVSVGGIQCDVNDVLKEDYGQEGIQTMSLGDDPDFHALAWRVRSLIYGHPTVQDPAGIVNGEPIMPNQWLWKLITDDLPPLAEAIEVIRADTAQIKADTESIKADTAEIKEMFKAALGAGVTLTTTGQIVIKGEPSSAPSLKEEIP